MNGHPVNNSAKSLRSLAIVDNVFSVVYSVYRWVILQLEIKELELEGLVR